jgi:hypothetical protein
VAELRVHEEPGAADREAVCQRFHRLGLLLRWPRTDAPDELLAFSVRAAQPDNPVSVRREGHVSTAQFAAAHAELEAWCREHGHERVLRMAAEWPMLRELER